MLSELELQKNMDLMYLDPDSCRIPNERSKRLSTLRTNIQQMSTIGYFNHCRQFRFVGRRPILEHIRLQNRVVTDMLQNSSGGTTVQPATKPVVTAEIIEPMPKPNIEPEDNTAIPMEKLPVVTNTAVTSNANAPMISGYVGVPYYVDPAFDETFGANFNSDSTVYLSQDMAPGLNLHRFGKVIGLPRAAGSFSHEFSVHKLTNSQGAGHSYEPQPIWKGKVSVNILPTPRFTVLNPAQRGFANFRIGYLNEKFPFLTAKTLPAFTSQTIAAVNGSTSGKSYFEVKVQFMDSTSYIGFVDSKDKDYGPRIWVKVSDDKLVSGDTLMFALDIESGNFWYGINGKWQPRKASPSDTPDPSKGTSPYFLSGEYIRFKAGAEYVPHIVTAPGSSGQGNQVTFNFGDQPWKFAPPSGFNGIAFKPVNSSYPNYWDKKTGSEYALTDFGVSYINQITTSAVVFREALPFKWAPVTFQAELHYLLTAKGDHILAKSPKSSGRWQFEVTLPDDLRSRGGIAPSNFDTKNGKLGSAGSKSISVRLRDTVMSETGKGVIEIDGKEFFFGPFDREKRGDARITFDCNFDSQKLTLYLNGTQILETSLPAGVNEWAIAANSISGSVYLSTVIDPNMPKDTNDDGGDQNVGYMKFPVAGAKPWMTEI